MVRLKYYVKTSKKIFYKNIEYIKDNNILKHFKEDNDNIFFISNKKIDIDGFNNVNIIQIIFKKIILPNLIFIIGLILMIGIILSTPYYIRDVKYDKNSIKDEAVYNYVLNSLEKSLINRELKISLNDLSKELSIVFSHYAFIGLKKVGSVIYINIELQDSILNQIDTNNKIGDFISKYDAYIEDIVVEKGFVVVNSNTVVKKGDLLISGNLKYSQNVFDNKFYISPKGYIIGNIIEFKKIIVNKNNFINSYNGNYSNYNKYEFFGRTYNDKRRYQNSILKEKIKFNIKGILTIYEITEYEKGEIEFTYDDNNVIEYCNSLIYCELEKNRISEKEKINKISLLKIKQDKDTYELLFLINKNVNIVCFKEYK